MRHDSSASRRKGKTPQRRAPQSPPAAPGPSGPPSECPSRSAAVGIRVLKQERVLGGSLSTGVSPGGFGTCSGSVQGSDSLCRRALKVLLWPQHCRSRFSFSSSSSSNLRVFQGPRRRPGRDGSDPEPRPCERSASSRRAQICCSGRGPSRDW